GRGMKAACPPLSRYLAPKLPQQLLPEVARRNRSLPDEEEMELLEIELVAEALLRFAAHRVDLILAEAVGNGLGRPLRIAEDGLLGAGAAGAFGVILQRR